MIPEFDLTPVNQGGPLMWVLLALSLFGLVIFLERTLYLHRGQIRSADFLDGIKNLLRKNRSIEALTLCEETPGPLARIVKTALLHQGRPEPVLRRAIQAAALLEVPLLERRIGSLGLIARMAPLIGLLGTLIAGIEILYNLNAEGAYAHSGDYAGLLGRALITTATGVGIAIVAQLAFQFLQGRVRALILDIEFVGHHLIQFLMHDLDESENSGEGGAPDPAPGERR